MRHAFARELIERAVQLNRIRGGERAVDLTLRRDQPDRADAGTRVPERGPDLARERGDRCLSAGAGHGRDHLRLARKEDRRRARQHAARVVDLDERHARGKRDRRRPFGHDRCRARRQRLWQELEPVGLRPCYRHEQVARLDGAAVRADARNLERGKAGVADGIRWEEVGKLHGAPDRLPSPPHIVQGQRRFGCRVPLRAWRICPIGRRRSPGSACRRAGVRTEAGAQAAARCGR